MHGREIDMMESITPQVPHMLGITPLNKVHDPKNEKMTLLDTQHSFWQDYEEDVRTKNKLMEKVETAIRSLKEDDIFRLTYPYGEAADVLYVEVDKIQSSSNTMNTTCADCGALLTTTPNLVEKGGYYYIKFSLECECGFSRNLERGLQRS
jgi:hypothetical protein